MTPDEFCLSDNLENILAIVLDQELQRYNELLSVMKETLESALNGLDGKCLVSEEMEEFIESIKDDEIPKGSIFHQILNKIVLLAGLHADSNSDFFFFFLQ